MIVRNVDSTDLPILDAIHSNHNFPCPSRRNLIDEKLVTDDNGQIIGYGQIKVLSEATIILNMLTSRRDRVEALNKFMEHAEQLCAERGIEQLHVFVEDKIFANLLIEKFGFSQASGRALVKNLE